MLKLFIYDYLNHIQSSRRLEREAYGADVVDRAITPDLKTIDNFIEDNTKAIKHVYREFVLICRKLNLFTDSLISIDGINRAGVHRNRVNPG